MRTVLPLFLLVLIAQIGLAQDDYMDQIAKASCTCLEKLSDELQAEELNMQMGLCIMEAAKPHQDNLKQDHDIDFAKIHLEGEKLGTLIGFRMASHCPAVLMKMAGQSDQVQMVEMQGSVVEGEVIDIKEGMFVEFSVQDAQGKVRKFYWMNFIKSDLELTSGYKSLQDKKVRVSYTTQEFFDARVSEYRGFNVIAELEVLD